ncbi:MAG: beta-N-acetylglucosaminidase domain-containing protein [Congregibacter sp.]
MIDWVARLGIDAYLYAPKADAALRKRWQEPWQSTYEQSIARLVACCERSGLDLHIGLSPFALYQAYTPKARQLLREKVLKLVELGCTGLGLLFDDMPGDVEDLAQRQAAICNDVADWLGPASLTMCPTYYSDDPALDNFFGQRPSAYLEVLGDCLDDSVKVFWTGELVVAPAIGGSHVADVARRLGRPLSLWDNYPVNDSKLRSEHIYAQPLPHRDPSMSQNLAAHWCNAMNQAALSLPALASLPALYGVGTAEFHQVLTEAGLTPNVITACAPLSTQTRSEFLAAAVESHGQFDPQSGETLAALELSAWLRGEYEFDPDCLTD